MSDSGSLQAPVAEGTTRRRRQRFNNRRYWETRYTTDLASGSGVGSRGEYLAYKWELLGRLIEKIRPDQPWTSAAATSRS